jgi:hypothetical protein
VATLPWQWLHCLRSVSASDLSGFGYYGLCSHTRLTPSCSTEGLHLCLVFIAWQVAHKSKSNYSRHLTCCSSSVCIWVRWGGVVSSFISCSTFGPLWALVHAWIDIPVVEYISLRDHFVQFTLSAGGSRARRSFMQLIWLACAWVVWTERNHRLFCGSANTLHQLLDKIKLFSFGWLKATSVTLASNCHSWWSNLLLCPGPVWTILVWL